MIELSAFCWFPHELILDDAWNEQRKFKGIIVCGDFLHTVITIEVDMKTSAAIIVIFLPTLGESLLFHISERVIPKFPPPPPLHILLGFRCQIILQR